MLDPEFMEQEYQIEEPIELYDISNLNNMEFEDEFQDC